MMMGPTKKKIIATGIVAFTIPTVISGVVFWQYNKKKNEEIEALKVKSAVTKAYVFTDNLLEGDIIAASDLMLVDTKGESAPIDSFSGDKYDLVGRRVRINAEAKTIVTESMLMDEVDKLPGISERYHEFNMFLLPSDLVEGDYIDIRITLPDGEDFVVVSGKEIKKLGTMPENNTIFLQLDEEELIRTTAAIIESYMSNGIKLYVTKYVDPSAQLYKSERINYVERFEKTLEELYQTRLSLVSGDNANPLEYIRVYGGTPELQKELLNSLINKLSGDMTAITTEEVNQILSIELSRILEGDYTAFLNEAIKNATSGDNSGDSNPIIEISKDDITNKEIAPLIGLTEKQTGDIRDGLTNNDDSLLALYNDKLLRTRLDMIETYPVKQNIATLIQNNPNILTELRAKYNVEDLKYRRATLQNLTAYEYDEFMQEYMPTEALSNLQTNLTKEIEVQVNERKAYLQALLLENS